MLKEEQKREFDIHAERMVRWLRANGHPHMTIIIDSTHAELAEGQMAVSIPWGKEAEQRRDTDKVGAAAQDVGRAGLQEANRWPLGAATREGMNIAKASVGRNTSCGGVGFGDTLRQAEAQDPGNWDVKGTTPNVREHPLYEQFTQAIVQAMWGKGVRHGGAVTPFLDQPWIHYARMHGIGFLTGQAAKKLEEAASTKTGDAFINEIRGAMVYLGMALIYHEEVEVKKLTAGLQKRDR